VSSQLNLGLIGAGRIGRLHAEHVAFRIPNARILIVADIDEEAAKAAADSYRINYAMADYKAILQSPAIDGVLICSATHTHAQIIIEAAAAGKHVFCEKPIDFDLAVIDHALAAVEKAGVKFQVGFNRRFDANYMRVQQAVADGEIGEPHLMHIISRDPAPPPMSYIRSSGGIFLDMTIHDLDMARFLLDEEVDEIYAAGGVMVDPAIGEAGDLDTAMLTLKFKSGAIGVIDNSRQAVYGYDQRVEILGSKGSVATGNNYPNAAVISTARAIQRDLPHNFFMERYTESYVNEVQAFVDAVLEDKPVPVGGSDGRISVAMGMAAARSVDENRPVKISEIG